MTFCASKASRNAAQKGFGIEAPREGAGKNPSAPERYPAASNHARPGASRRNLGRFRALGDARVRGRLPDNPTMPLDTMLRTVRAETASQKIRANDLAETVTALLRAGRDCREVKRELFGVLDGLALLRTREHAIEVM